MRGVDLGQVERCLRAAVLALPTSTSSARRYGIRSRSGDGVRASASRTEGRQWPIQHRGSPLEEVSIRLAGFGAVRREPDLAVTADLVGRVDAAPAPAS